jgi:type IV pilus assembly protein PilW
MLKQKGLSLVELMIAITLGLILLTGVMQVFLSSKNVFTSQQALSRIQESGRMAIEFLSRDIRMAGFMGCASRSEAIKVNNMLNKSDTVTYNFKEGIKGYAQADFPVASSDIGETIAKDTDVIVLRYAIGSGVYVTKNNDSAQLFVNDTGDNSRTCKSGVAISGLCSEDILVVTDCEKANVFQTTNVKAGTGTADDKVNVVHSNTALTPGNAIASWGGNSDKENTFNAGAQILSARSMVYFVANGFSGRPGLWQNVNGTSLELLEGVEDIHISYGVDTEVKQDFIPNEYKLAKDVANWDRVVAVRIELLIASIEDNMTQDHQVYTFPTDAASSTTAADFRLRQVFSSTVAIRNRIN